MVFIFQSDIVKAQSSDEAQSKWQRYDIEQTGLSLELPTKPSQISLSDLPDALKSPSRGKIGYSAKSGNLNATVTAWQFSSDFEAEIALRGFIAGAGFPNGNSTLKFSYDAQTDRENISGECLFELKNKVLERKSAAIIKNGKAWLVEADYPQNKIAARADALRIINSMQITDRKSIK